MKIAGINWTDKPINSLGIYFGIINEESQRLNWENKIEKINKPFCAWGKSVCLVPDIYHTPNLLAYFCNQIITYHIP